MPWGQTSAARRAERAATSADRFFLKTFRDKETRVRFVLDDPYNAWFEYKEHYDRWTRAKGAKSDGISYPCAKPTGAQICLGCDYPLPEDHNPNPGVDDKGKDKRCECRGCQIRSVNSRWIVPVIDDKDFLSLFKIGVRLWQDICGSYELFNTITNCDYAVVKSGDGTWNNTQYSAKPLPGTDGERKPKIRVPDYDRLLRNKYLEAIEAYDVDPAAIGFDVTSATPETPEEVSDGGHEPDREGVPETPDSEDHGPDPVPDGAEHDDPPSSLQSPEEIKAKLAAMNVPFPADATPEQLRSLLDAFTPKAAPAQAAQPETPAAPPAAAPVSNGNGSAPASDGGPIDFKSWTTPDVIDYLRQDPAVDEPNLDRKPRSTIISLAERKQAAVAAGQPVS